MSGFFSGGQAKCRFPELDGFIVQVGVEGVAQSAGLFHPRAPMFHRAWKESVAPLVNSTATGAGIYWRKWG